MLKTEPMEARILSELAEAESKIRELTLYRDALQRFLAEVRKDGMATREVTRKNSYSRIAVENKIISELKEVGKPMSARLLLIAARQIHYGLKAATFRSYMHRMKERGLVSNVATRRGHWTLVEEMRGSG